MFSHKKVYGTSWKYGKEMENENFIIQIIKTI